MGLTFHMTPHPTPCSKAYRWLIVLLVSWWSLPVNRHISRQTTQHQPPPDSPKPLSGREHRLHRGTMSIHFHLMLNGKQSECWVGGGGQRGQGLFGSSIYRQPLGAVGNRSTKKMEYNVHRSSRCHVICGAVGVMWHHIYLRPQHETQQNPQMFWFKSSSFDWTALTDGSEDEMSGQSVHGGR